MEYKRETQNTAGWIARGIAALPILFFLVNLYRMRSGSIMLYMGILIISGGFGLLTALLNRSRMASFLLFSGVYLFTLALNLVFIKNVDAGSFVTSALLLALTPLTLRRRWTKQWGAAGFYLSAAIIILALMTRTKTRIFSGSNNFISVVMILAAVIYYLPMTAGREKLRIRDLAPAFVCFFVSVWAAGRGGILSTAFLVVLILFVFMKQFIGRDPKRLALLIIFLGLILAGLLLLSDALLSWFMSLGKLRTRGLNGGDREVIWTAYFDKMLENPLYLLLGSPLREVEPAHVLGDNTHNSFLQFHAYNGILPLLLFLAALVVSVVRNLKKRDYLMLSLIAVVVLRAMTDKFIFSQYGMPFMLYLVFSSFDGGPGELPEKEEKKIPLFRRICWK